MLVLEAALPLRARRPPPSPPLTPAASNSSTDAKNELGGASLAGASEETGTIEQPLTSQRSSTLSAERVAADWPLLFPAEEEPPAAARRASAAARASLTCFFDGGVGSLGVGEWGQRVREKKREDEGSEAARRSRESDFQRKATKIKPKKKKKVRALSRCFLSRRSLRYPLRLFSFYCLSLSSRVSHAIDAKKEGKREELDEKSEAAISAGRRHPQETRGGGAKSKKKKQESHHHKHPEAVRWQRFQCSPWRSLHVDIASRPFPI